MNLASLTMLDIISFFIILISAINGYRIGLIKGVSFIVGIIIGVFIASSYSHTTGAYIAHYIDLGSQTNINFAGFIVTIIGVWIGIVLLSNILSSFLYVAGFSFLDSILGFLYSSVKTFVILSIVFYFVKDASFISKQVRFDMQNSYIYPYYTNTANIIVKNFKIDTITKEIKSVLNKLTAQAKELIKYY